MSVGKSDIGKKIKCCLDKIIVIISDMPFGSRDILQVCVLRLLGWINIALFGLQ